MLKPIADLPDGVLGFEASGEIQASDYRDTLMPAVRDVWARGDEIRITVTSLFGWMTPGELKRFPVAGRDQAIAWAAGDG
jgi:hypothetical protein